MDNWPVRQWGWYTTGQTRAGKMSNCRETTGNRPFAHFLEHQKWGPTSDHCPPEGKELTAICWCHICRSLACSWFPEQHHLHLYNEKRPQKVQKIVSKVRCCNYSNSNSIWCGIWSACCYDYVCICVHLCTNNYVQNNHTKQTASLHKQVQNNQTKQNASCPNFSSCTLELFCFLSFFHQVSIWLICCWN